MLSVRGNISLHFLHNFRMGDLGVFISMTTQLETSNLQEQQFEGRSW